MNKCVCVCVFVHNVNFNEKILPKHRTDALRTWFETNRRARHLSSLFCWFYRMNIQHSLLDIESMENKLSTNFQIIRFYTRIFDQFNRINLLRWSTFSNIENVICLVDGSFKAEEMSSAVFHFYKLPVDLYLVENRKYFICHLFDVYRFTIFLLSNFHGTNRHNSWRSWQID